MDYNQLNPCDQGLLNNNFLRYGWRRYKHALIGKDTKRNCYILGVPGTYNRQEALMAGMFGFPYFKEAKLVLICEKVYAQDILEENFINKDIVSEHYQKKDFHTMYIGLIKKVLINEN